MGYRWRHPLYHWQYRTTDHDPWPSFIRCHGRIKRHHESLHPRSPGMVSMTCNDVMVGLKVMGHHLDEHGLP